MPKRVDHLTPFKPMGEVSLAGKPLCVKVAPEIDDYVRSLPNTSAWLRRVVTEAALKELLQSDGRNAVVEVRHDQQQ